MARGRHLNAETALLNCFETIGNRRLSLRHKNERFATRFHREIFRHLQKFRDNVYNPNYRVLYNTFENEGALIVRSPHWPNKFLKISEREYYKDNKRSEFSINTCKTLKEDFPSFHDICKAYALHLFKNDSESDREKLFKSKCSRRFHKETRDLL